MIFDLEDVASAWELDPEFIHLNHGSFGAVPTVVLAEQRTWQKRMHTNPSAYFRRDVFPAIADARRTVSQFLGAGDDGLGFVRNSTEAINTVLSSHRLQPGDEILIFDQEYQAVTMAVGRAARLAGAQVIEIAVSLHESDDQILEQVRSRITSRTRMLVVDNITSATARIMPVAQLVNLCREQSIVSVVDASHVPGVLDPRISELKPDYWFGNLHKWLCAPVAAGVLYVAPEHRESFQPLITSWFDALGFPAAQDMLGTVDYSAWLCAPRAIEFFGEFGFDRVRAANNARAVYGQQVVAQALGTDADALRDYGLPMTLVPLERAGDHEAAGAMSAHIALTHGIEAAITDFRGQLFIRISGQLYNRAEDYHALAAALVRAREL